MGRPKKESAARHEALLMLREDRLEAGEQWFLISSAWWKRVFPADAAGGREEEDDEQADAEQDQDTAQDPIVNEPLVDTEISDPKRHSVVLKPQLAEERDYRVVSERVWRVLANAFGFDLEISRSVVAHGPNRKLVVEIYPVLFQIFLWRNGMDADEVLPVQNEARNAPLVLLVSQSSTLADVQTQIWTAMQSNFQQYFPNVPVDDVHHHLRLCYRVAELASWVPLQDVLAMDNKSYEEDRSLAACVGELELEPRDYKAGPERYHHLLVEGRFYNSEKPTDWRNTKFFSEIKANAWRLELKVGDLVDGQDTEKKWYESRVIEIDGKRVKIHYRGWTERWDEWFDVMTPRIEKLHTHVKKWREFKVGDSVLIGTPRGPGKFPDWQSGTAVAVELAEDGKLTVQFNIDGVTTDWMDAQDEMLCPLGTHKAINAKASPPANGFTRPTLGQTSYSSMSYTNRFSSDRSRGYSYDSVGKGRPEFAGVVGLQNLGNTCFLNSMLQCLINAHPLKDYFLRLDDDGEKTESFTHDINANNPLGMKGMIAIEFAKLVKRMWGSEYTIVAPTGLKSVIGQYAPQFAGYQQQDSQEVMNFLLDGLHEDLNRVRSKPYTNPVEHNGRADAEVAEEEWTQYRRRNDSVIVDNFMGQLRSHVTCSDPNCGNESVTFDPFMSLSVPIPSEEIVTVQVQLFWADGRIPMKYAVQVEKAGSTLRDVKEKLCELSGVPFSRLLFVEVYGHRITRVHKSDLLIEDLREDVLHAYELELPVNEYEFCSRNLRPVSARAKSVTDSDQDQEKSMQLVALLHQAPVASPSDPRNGDDVENGLTDDRYGAKQRRVEVKLFNTPLLVSIDRNWTRAEVHAKVWQIVQRLVSTEDAAAKFGGEESQTLPYRLHVTQPSGTMTYISDFPRTDEPSNLPDVSEQSFSFTLEWSRHGYQDGYDESMAKRIDVHESMKKLRISSTSTASESVSLLNCLTKFTEREQLGKTDTWYCPKCKNHVRAFKKFDLFALPKVLIFHLKRFRYAQSSFYMHRDKITKLVEFPIEDLDLSEYVAGPQGQNMSLMYDLFAVSEHSGGLGGGHYTAICKNPENERWFSFNDSFTSETSASKAVTPRAYVLFYVRRDTETGSEVDAARL